jgi:hypothetical protein
MRPSPIGTALVEQRRPPHGLACGDEAPAVALRRVDALEELADLAARRR